MSLPHLLALWRANGIGPATITRLRDQQINLTDLFYDPRALVQQYSLPEKLIMAVKDVDWRLVENDLTWAQKPNCHIITHDMTNYPFLLQQISASPPLLFVEGDPRILNDAQIAIVGSRHPTPIGKDLAQQFAQSLTQAGLVITSGLAQGIDTASHEGALIDGKTIAIMGTGADTVYPASNRHLKQRIAANGAVITELPTGVTVSANNFPRRNRLISGISLGVLIIEAALESGSLITAKYALEHNREVFALPGSIHNPLARGCHALIKQGATLIETTQEILTTLQWRKRLGTTTTPIVTISNDDLPLDQQKILHTMGFDTISINQLIQNSGLTAEAVSSMLLLLEIQGYITAVPGGYMRCLRG